jgi:hypothetical protein
LALPVRSDTYGLLTDSPFVVEVERDLSVQQQLLDGVMVRRGSGEFSGRLPDRLQGLRANNLITFKPHREPLDAWAMLELIGHYVAYRKLVSPSTSDLLPDDHFSLYAVRPLFPQTLSGHPAVQVGEALKPNARELGDNY